MAEKINNLPSEEWEYLIVNQLGGGLVQDIPVQQLENSQFPKLENVIFKKGQVLSDTGYAKFGNIVLGIPRAAFQFFLTDGTDYLCLVTNTVFYTWANGTSSWTPYDAGNNTTTTAAALLGATSVDLTDVTGYAVGDIMCITLDSGVIQAVTITVIATLTVTFTEPLQEAAASGNAVYETTKFSGSDDIQPSFTVFPANDWLCWTNGVDSPFYFDGSTLAVIPGLPSAGATLCKLVSTFNNRLILAHTNEAGVAYPQRVRWCDAGDPTNWSTGDSGYQDLYDNEDFLLSVAPLGPFLIYYRDRSIVRTEYVGSASKLFNFETVISGEGSLSQDSVLDVGDFHTFFGNANIYNYKGGFDLEPLGDAIYYKMFSSTGELVPNTKHRTFGLYIEELDESWFVYPDDSSQTYPSRVIRYNSQGGGWWQRKFPVEISGFGYFANTGSVTWNDWDGLTWNDLNFAWNAKNLQANAPIILLCGKDGQVYQYDYNAIDDDGTAIAYSITTKAFGHPRVEYRFDEFEFYLSGVDILIEYSLDRGKTWLTLGTFNPGVDVISQRSWKQLVGNYLSLRFSGSSTFTLESFSFQHSMESEHGG